MNEPPPPSNDALPDDPVEARIVAWVLGEASAFEAAELERLCAEKPELLVFRRRMRALHGLLTEAESAEPDDSWKLPAEKRKVLDEIFSQHEDSPSPVADLHRERRISHSGRRAAFAIAACVVVTFFVVRLVPFGHEAQAVIEIRSFSTDTHDQIAPQFFGTEFEKIKSSSSLGNVVDSLALGSRWGVDRDAAIKRLRDGLITENLKGTDLLSIRVREKTDVDAREITRALAENYAAYRTKIEEQAAQKSLTELNKAIRDQEDKVEERRKVLATIVRTKGITYKGQDSFDNGSGVDEDTREDAIKRGLDHQDYADAKRDFENDQELLQQMRLKQIDSTVREKVTEGSVIIHEMPQLAENERTRVVDFASKQSVPAPASPPPPPAAPMDQVARNEPQIQLESAAPVNPASLMPTDEGRSDAKPAELDSVAAARRQQPSKKSAVPPAEPAASPPVGMADGSLAGNAVGRSMPGESLRQPRPRVTPFVGAEGKKEQLAEDSIEAVTPEMNLALEDSKASGGSGGGRTEAMPSQSRAGMNLFKQSGADQPAASPESQFDMVERLKNDNRSEIERRIEDIDPGYTRVLGGMEHRVPTTSFEDDYIREKKASDPALSGNEGKVAAKGDALLNEGREAYAKGEYQQAVEKYRYALEHDPDEDHRKNYTAHLGDASVALSMQHRKVGKYTEARELLDGVLAKDPSNEEAKRELGYLDDPIRSNPALNYQHGELTDEVRRSLYTAEGNFNLGKYDEAKREFETALRVDPYNAAARRGLERVDTAKTDYYRAAYDHTRAELLGTVDKSWELTLPAEKDADPADQDFDLKKRLEGEVAQQAERVATYTGMRITPPARDLGDDAVKEAGEFMTLRRLDTAFLKKQAEELSEKINASGETGDRSVQFRQWQSINGELIRRAKLENEQKMIEVLDETSASENPYSTFSLNISDASFQMAKAALEKGERPDPASIKPEQFYNAVEYGDPAPAAGEPVAATVEQSVHPVIPGRSLVRVAVRTGASGRSEAQPLRLTLLVDQSGSMVREDRRAAMEKALSQLSGLLTKDDVVNVIGFSRKARLLADGMKGDQSGKLGTLVNQTANEGGTNLEEAMKLGSELAARHQLAGAQNRIVLFTDGAANLGDADPARLADQVKTLRQKGISFDIAGIAADDLNDRLLSELARNGNGRYYVVGDGAKDDSFARQLAGAFRPAAENVKIQVIFNPRRVSRYKLVGFEKDRLKTEDFRNDAVDAAELAAEETGIAIYQVEEIPDGAGEIGELSVRFRDTASGDMVERSWTLPHASSATPFDRCTPSMQLAGLSLLAAEKLRGGPAADAIDFGQLSGTIGSVKQYYGSSSGVGDMLSLIDSIK